MNDLIFSSRHKFESNAGIMQRLHSLILIFLLVACSADVQGRVKIFDLIRPVRLEAGKTDTLLVSDLFYAESYPLEFQGHPEISIHFDPSNRKLMLRPDAGFEGYTTVSFKLNDQSYDLPVLSRIKPIHTFRYRPNSPPEFRMNIMGNFNNWNRTNLPLSDTDGDGEFEITLAFDPGQYLYQFVTDSTETPDPNNPRRVDNGFGGFNSVVEIQARHSGKAYLHLLNFEKDKDVARVSFFYETEADARGLKPEHVLALINNKRLPENAFSLQDNKISVTLDPHDLEDTNTLRVAITNNGQSTNLQTINFLDGEPAGAQRGFSSWQDAIIYSIMIDRFFDGDKSNSLAVRHDSLLAPANYKGGDLAGILAKLEEGYFDALGVNTLWLSPVYENTDKAFREWPQPRRYFSGYHGYWPIHPQKVESRFGDLALLKKLVDAAHKRDIKVLLDFVANHVHEEHPFFREHRDWFGKVELPGGRMNIRLWDEHRLTTWFDTFMPSFDYQNSIEAIQVMTGNAVWWLEETGADGFRHDAVKHVPNSFWRELTQKIKAEVASKRTLEVYQIGETFGSYDLVSSYVNNGQLNGQFDFNLYDIALATFLNPESSFDMLAGALQKSADVYGAQHLMGNMMDSHDKVRFMAYADGDLSLAGGGDKEIGWSNPPQVNHATSYDMARLYLTYLLTIPGVPIIYYGDEIGLTGASDPDNRRIMRFDTQLTHAEQGMLAAVRKLVNLRRRHSAMRYGDLLPLHAGKNCFAYLRSDLNERILVVLNKSENKKTVRLRLPDFISASHAIDLLGGMKLDLTKPASLEVPALSGLIFKI